MTYYMITAAPRCSLSRSDAGAISGAQQEIQFKIY